jgi:hypothetical protein
MVKMKLELLLITFFLLAALSLCVVYLADPSIYTETLLLTPAPRDRYPILTTLFLLVILVFIAILIIGVWRHWRWLFWLLLIAFGCSILEIPAALLQLAGLLPGHPPLWYSLYRMGVALIAGGMAVWMFQIYRHAGVWARGRKAASREQIRHEAVSQVNGGQETHHERV